MSDHNLWRSSESGEDLSVLEEQPVVNLVCSTWIIEITVPDKDE